MDNETGFPFEMGHFYGWTLGLNCSRPVMCRGFYVSESMSEVVRSLFLCVHTIKFHLISPFIILSQHLCSNAYFLPTALSVCRKGAPDVLQNHQVSFLFAGREKV